MKCTNVFALILLAIMTFACNNDKTDTEQFAIEVLNNKPTYTDSDTLQLRVSNPENKDITQVIIAFDGKQMDTGASNTYRLSLSGSKMGKRKISATITAGGEDYTTESLITVLASEKPILYTYQILETYPHDIHAYTQGLEFQNDTLYESTGQYGHSKLRKTDYRSGKVWNEIPLSNQYFGEGLTILNGKIYQLTYKEMTGFIYDLNRFERTGTFVYNQSKEGWGLCNDGQQIYKSDGSERIWTLNPETLSEEGFIEIYTNTSKIPRVNELEWVEGKIYANIYQKGAVAIVNPKNGAVEGVIDLNGLINSVRQHEELDVLNGIAYKGEPNILYVTGKNWDKLFKIEIIERR